MIIPDGDPSELLVAQLEVIIIAVGGKALAIIVQRDDCFVRQWDAIDGVPVAVITLLVLVDVITQVDHVVYGILACGIANGIEKAKRTKHWSIRCDNME